VSVCVLTRLAQVTTANAGTRNFARRDLLMNFNHKPKTRSVWPSLLVYRLS